MLSPVEKKWRLFRSYAGGFPLWCAWQVTYRCNFRCSFCHYWKDPMGADPEPTVKDFQTGAKRLAGMGSLMISLAGGEPLIRTDLPEIVGALSEFHFPFVTTNGYLADRSMTRDLMDAGLWGASVSVDYADQRKHDRRRGVRGAWHAAVKAIEQFVAAAKNPWQRVNMMAVLMDDNLDEIEGLLKLSGKLGAYFMVQPYCHLKTGSKRYQPGTDGVSERLLELRSRYGNFLSNKSFLSKFDQAADGGVPGCRAGKSFFNIDSRGDVAICVERRAKPVANIVKDKTCTIVHELRRAAKGNTCRKCWYNCRGEIEAVFDPEGLLCFLPTLLFDRSRPRT
jgi:MoaA/NifB/PqqE/SkfB family radical SAM enzyme